MLKNSECNSRTLRAPSPPRLRAVPRSGKFVFEGPFSLMKFEFFANFRGKLGAIQHERAQSAPSLGIKRPHKNNQKCKKAPD